MKLDNNEIPNIKALKEQGWNDLNEILNKEMPIASGASGLSNRMYFSVLGGLLLLGLGYLAGRAIPRTETTVVHIQWNKAAKTLAQQPPVKSDEENPITVGQNQADQQSLLAQFNEINTEPETRISSNKSSVNQNAFLSTTKQRGNDKMSIRHTPPRSNQRLTEENIVTNISSSKPRDYLSGNSGKSIGTKMTDLIDPIQSDVVVIDESNSSSLIHAELRGLHGKPDNEVNRTLVQNNQPPSIDEDSLNSESEKMLEVQVVKKDDQDESKSKPILTDSPSKINGWELAASGGISLIPNGSLGYLGRVSVFKRIYGPLKIGLSYGQTDLRMNGFAQYSANKTIDQGSMISGEFEDRQQTTLDEIIEINDLTLNQAGIHLSYDISPRVNINFSLLNCQVGRLNYQQTSTFTDSSVRYLNNEFISASQEKVYTNKNSGRVYGSGLGDYNLSSFMAYELGLRLNISKHVAAFGQVGFANNLSFSKALKPLELNNETSYRAIQATSSQTYFKTGITLFF